MLTYHRIGDGSVWQWVRAARRLRDLPLLVERGPQLRKRLFLGVFWKPSHAFVPAALMGVALQRRFPLAVMLIAPWAVLWEPRHDGIRGRLRHLTELPGWALVDVAEVITLVDASVRHRSIVL
jgi:hypothetical protein